MPSIGETLREARMRQRLDIADVEERTKIRAKYLRALENEEFGLLPGPTFVKTFLRTYAEALGLDPHVLVEEYRTGHEREDDLEMQPLGPPAVAGRDRRHRPRLGRGSVVLLALAAVVAALVAIGLATDDSGGGDRASSVAETQTETKAQTAPEPARPKGVVLRIVPDTPTYVCVDRGPGAPRVFEATIEDAQTFRGRRLRVNLGKTDVRVTVNGRAVDIEPGPDPVGYAFTLGRTRPLPVGQRPCA